MKRAFWILLLIVVCRTVAAAEWQPKQAPLMTRWAKDVTPETAHREYPRPQLVRKNWQNLNGLWDLAITEAEAAPPKEFSQQILVPFPVESALSGVMQRVDEKQRIWYRRSFQVPQEWKDQTVLLHFGASDWETLVLVNGRQIGQHRGGYDPFSIDITEALKENGEQEILVGVQDPTDKGVQPRGKQIQNPHSIWYTPISGIWQTVWLEPVPRARIEGLEITPNVDAGSVRILPRLKGVSGEHTLGIEVLADGESIKKVDASLTDATEISLGKNPRLWSPESPFLYDLKISLCKGDEVVDEVTSYFGLRSISLGKDAEGITRIMLNGKPVFQYGLLDQGFWPDGLYTAPTDEALRYDIEVTKKLGYNMARKHVKVEPVRWYYWCDKLGLLVWQDMPNGDRHIGADDPDIQRSSESAEQYELELKRMIDALRNHPSIVMWVPFNEGWGQFDTARIAELVKEQDPTRLVNSVSGWADRGVGDVHDIHVYPGPSMPKPEEDRAAVLGEFGGLGLPIKGHTWQDEKNWGYRSFETKEALNDAYLNLMTALRPLIGKGLSAAVYTQTTDVEIEVNGVMTYDRAILKFDAERVKDAHRRLHLPPPKLETVVPTSREEGQTWQYTTIQPDEGWREARFDSGSWKEGRGGFGTEGTPGATIGTRWDGKQIWLRREFQVDTDELQNPHVLIHHDEDAKVYIDGELAGVFSGYTTDYVLAPVRRDAAAKLKPGRHVLAVECQQTGGGQYIDVGIVDVVEKIQE